jgi:hypothetical protein
MPSILATSAAAVSVLAAMLADPHEPSVAQPQWAAPPEGAVSIDLVTVGGSGCPPGTAAVEVTSGNDAFVVTYGAYHAQVGVGARPTDFRRNCQLNIAVRVPDGYSYAINGVEHRGQARLAAGASGVQRSNYYYAGQTTNAFTEHRFTGPFDDDWQTIDEFDPALLIFSPCGIERNLNINTEIRAIAGTSDQATTNSSITMDSTTSSTYRFIWRTCD